MFAVYRATSVKGPKNKLIDDKIEAVNVCFQSFYKAFSGYLDDLVVLLDKPTPELRAIFTGYTKHIEETFYTDFNEGNINSFHRQLDIATSQNNRYLLCEDDYYFLPHAGEIIAVDTLQFPFYTPYDHPRYYDEEAHMIYPRLVTHPHLHHWQTIRNTTLTFGGDVPHLHLHMETMKHYGWNDYAMWNDITESTNLYAPIPTLATHIETEHLSYGTDWLQLLKTPHA